MTNISMKGESLALKPNEVYIAIESLYLDKIKQEIHNLKKDDLLNEIKNKIFTFPYTDLPFAKFTIGNNRFAINKITKINYDKITDLDKDKCFSTDTGLIILLVPRLIEIFVQNYDYKSLVDSIIEPINLCYWKRITACIPSNEIGLILAPGINSGFEFEGGGVYKINL